jgi:NADPH:quinone reductase-like Zn-dependent oxidoreductase
MRAVLLRGHGGLEQLEVRDDVPVPEPGPGEVRVRVRASALNNTDINLRTGWYSKDERAEDASWTGGALSFPRIQGADCCGEIVALGAGVDAARLGQRVLVDPVLRGAPGSAPRYLGSDCPGAFADFVCVPDGNAIAVHGAASDAELAALPCAYGAAENMLARTAVGPGETVLVTGASGGVGAAAVQLARRRGATVIALAAVAKAAAVAELGAARVLARGADLLAALGRESVDVAIDVVGGEGFAALLEVLRRGGRLGVAGAIAGPVVALDLRTVYLKDLALHGCTVPAPGTVATLAGYVERGELRPAIGAGFALGDIVAAQRAFLAKAHVGKIVLRP